MPQSTLLVITSPLLIGQAPAADAALSATSTSHVLVADAAMAAPLAVMPLSWTLANGDIQDQPPTGSQPVEAGEETAEGDPPEEGEIVVQGSYGPPETDPMEQFNAQSFRIMQGVDEALVAPLAYAYQDGLPGTLRTGLRNVVRNLGEPNNALNFLLQLKFGKAFETLTRFAINSTLGLGGLIDIAGEPGVGLPYRRNGWGNTMGYYGIGPGPYLVVPVAGSTTARDVIGSGLDQALLPVVVGRPFNQPEYGIPVFLVSNLQSRLEIDERLQRINASDDPYGSQREGYLAEREAIIEEFREGSPLQGIPDSERDPSQRLNPGPEPFDEEAYEAELDSEFEEDFEAEGPSSAADLTPTAREQLVLTQRRREDD